MLIWYPIASNNLTVGNRRQEQMARNVAILQASSSNVFGSMAWFATYAITGDVNMANTAGTLGGAAGDAGLAIGMAIGNRLPQVKAEPVTTLVTAPNIMHIGGSGNAGKNPVNSTGEINQTNCIPCAAGYIASYLKEPVAPISDFYSRIQESLSWVTANRIWPLLARLDY